MSNVAIICRGIPGSGKSTITKQIVKTCAAKNLSCKVHSTDDKCIVNGMYEFNPDNLNRNHAMTLNEFNQSIANQVNVVICDNTNCRVPNYRPYLDSAKEAGYEVAFICFIPGEIDDHMARNIHNVPKDTLIKMKHTLTTNWNVPRESSNYIYEVRPDMFAKNGADSLVESILRLVR